MALVNTRTLIYAKVESTYGTDPTPTNTADAIVAYEVEGPVPEIDMLERRDFGPTLGREKELPGRCRASIKFITELRGSGTAGTAPKGMSGLFQACACSETVSGGVSVTYAPSSASLKSVTIWIFKDGLKHIINGAVGNFEIVLESGETPKIKWDFVGLYATPTDVALPTNATPDTTVPKVCKGLTVTFDSYSAVFRKFSFKSNNTIAERGDLNASTGIAGFQIVERNPEGSFESETVLVATKNWYTKWEAGTAQAMSLSISNGAGNIVTITAAQCQTRKKEYADSDGILTDTIEFQMAKSSTTTSDEYSIALT